MNMNKKWLPLLLSLALVFSLILPGTLAWAADGDTSQDNGVELTKTAKANGDGTYKIRLDAYATGELFSSTTSTGIPTDFILVLDQSGSMDNDFTFEYSEYTAYTGDYRKNSNLFAQRHNGGNENLWYKPDPEVEEYFSVSVETTEAETEYSPIPTDSVNSIYSSYASAGELFEKVGDEYKPVTVEMKTEWLGFSLKTKVTYTFSDGSTYVQYGDLLTIGNSKRVEDMVPETDKLPLYYASKTYQYTYSYTVDGVKYVIGSSVGADTLFDDEVLYYATTSSQEQTKLGALKTAVESFSNAVAEDAAGEDGDLENTSDNVAHRIAVVGFASGNRWQGRNYNYRNTELFIGPTEYRYGANAADKYDEALQAMDTIDGQNNVKASINALSADGGTLIHLGMEMANGILESNPVKEGEIRNRVVIVFTDGQPGWSGYDGTYANSAISEAFTAKNTHGATVYSVGIFEGADGSNPSQLPSGNNTANSNKFMHLMSSNYPSAQSMNVTGSIASDLGNKSYYLSAQDSAALNQIFVKISQEVTTGGSTTTLNTSAVVRDTISQYFQLPSDATADDVKVYTVPCIGADANGNLTWGTSETAPSTVEADFTDDRTQVYVTGFDFAENWCGPENSSSGTSYRGNKLVIEFDVEPKAAFLGGNQVPTNAGAGIYENQISSTPVESVDSPVVDVPIKNVVVEAENYNVYLLGSVTEDPISAKIGDITLDLTKTDGGLQQWQYDYVDLAITSSSSPEGGYTNLTEDQSYSATVTVTPKYDPTTADDSGSTVTAAVAKTGTDSGTISVFVPHLTFQDGTVDYKSTIDNATYKSNNAEKTFAADNYVSYATVWKHGDALSNAEGITMNGDVPELGLTYAPSSGVTDGVVTAMDQVPVNVDVMIGNENVNGYTTFIHSNCEFEGCKWDDLTPSNGDPAFLLHVINTVGDLTIVKMAAENTNLGDQTFLFTVTGPDDFSMEVVIQGAGSVTIKDLPVGTYTVKEDTAWSWRFTPVGNIAENVTVGTDGGTAEFTNKLDDGKWFDGNAYCENKFGAYPSSTGE